MTFRLPPPPRFNLPPPPLIRSGYINSRVLQLTCGTLGQRSAPTSSLLTGSVIFLITGLLVFIVVCIRFLLDRKSAVARSPHKLIYPIVRNPSTCTSRSYATVSSGIYLESVPTSATALSARASYSACNSYRRISSPPTY